MRIAQKDRFNEMYSIDNATGCWLWRGYLNEHGYGTIWNGTRRTTAHRHSYLMHVGAIPEGMHVDHICRTRACCNPDHLRVVTPRQNSLENSVSFSARNAKMERCLRGHPFTFTGGRRQCLVCRKERAARNRADPAYRERQRVYLREYYREHPEKWAAYEAKKKECHSKTPHNG